MRGPVLLPALVLALIAFAGCKKTGGDEEQKEGIKKDGKERTSLQSCGDLPDYGGVKSLSAPEGASPASGDVLVRRLPAEPGTLNPVLATDVYEQDVNYYVMEGLLDMDLDTGELKPLLAKSWEVSEDKLTFTYHLRKDVTFHDGHKMTAEDFIYTLDRILDPKVDAPVLRSFFGDCESYKALDDYTVRVKWEKPYFKALSTVGSVPVLPKHILDDGTDFNRHPFGRNPVGTGPYKFVKWDTGQRILVERYDDYWGEAPNVDGVYFKIITEDEVALRVLKKGELDLYLELNPTQWVRQTTSKSFLEKFNKIRYDYPTYNYIGWNLRKPLFQDKRVRHALTMLLDRELIRKEVFKCQATVANGPFYHKGPYADPRIRPFPYDPEKARKLLSEAGWKDTDNDGTLDKDGKEFRFEMAFTSGVPTWEQMSNVYRQDLKKVGIDMEIRKMEWASFLEKVQDWKFDACCMGWGLVSNPDPYQLWHSSQADQKGSSNHVGFKNEKVDELIEKNRREFDRQKRIEYCRQIHRIIHEEQPYTFCVVRKHLTAADKRFHNIVPHNYRPVFDFNEWYVPEELQEHKSMPK